MTSRPTRQIAWDLGSIVPDRPLQPIKWAVPKDIALEGANIVTGLSGNRLVSSGAGMLTAFVRLHESPDAAILRFARKWGMMGFCKHGLPFTHNWPYALFHGENVWNEECNALEQGCLYTDPIVYWRKFSALADAILNIASELNQDKPANKLNWQIANVAYLLTGMRTALVKSSFKIPPLLSGRIRLKRPFVLRDAPICYSADNRSQTSIAEVVENERHSLSSLVTLWIRLANIGPTLVWNRDSQRWDLTFSSLLGPSLFGAIGLSLMMAISERGGLAICSCCHKSYVPIRQPNPHRRNYCPTCGIQAAWRDASADRRKRSREQRTQLPRSAP